MNINKIQALRHRLAILVHEHQQHLDRLKAISREFDEEMEREED